jgi:hypothetical protein
LAQQRRQAKDFSEAQRLQMRQDLSVPILSQFHLVDGRVAARRPDGGGAVQLHFLLPAIGRRAMDKMS